MRLKRSDAITNLPYYQYRANGGATKCINCGTFKGDGLRRATV